VRGDRSASVAFVAGNPGTSPVTNYQYRLDDGPWVPFDPPATTSPVTIGNLTNGTLYTIRLRAISAVGEGAASAPVTVTPGIPQPPIAVTLIPGDEEAWVTFGLVANATAYEIEFALSPTGFGDNWQPIASANPPFPLQAADYLPDGERIVNNQPLCVRVRSITPLGASDPSTPVCATPNGDVQYGTPGVELVLATPEGESGAVDITPDGTLAFDFTLKNNGTTDLANVWLKPFLPTDATLIGIEAVSGGTIAANADAWYWQGANLTRGGGTGIIRITVRLENR
jgi:titin